MKFIAAVFLTFLSIAVDPLAAQPCVKVAEKAAGSTTMYPYVLPLAGNYSKVCTGYTCTVEQGGSGAGAKRVCGDATLGAVDIGDLSRPLKSTEGTLQSDGFTSLCVVGDKVSYVARLTVANDALVFDVKKGSTGAAACLTTLKCLSKDQIRWMYSNLNTSALIKAGWSSSSVPNQDGNDSTKKWSELNSKCAATEIVPVGLDSTFGENDFFIGIIFNASASEGFGARVKLLTTKAAVNTLVAGNTSAIGFNDLVMGATSSTLQVASLRNAAGVCVAPTVATVQAITYPYFSREVYMVLNKKNCTRLKAALGFVNYTITTAGQKIISSKGGVALTTAQQTVTRGRIATLAKCT
jgi:ABC-type phosphate transport system substrate-binding protein